MADRKAQLNADRRARREIANYNERRRMKNINDGFEVLKDLLPVDGEKTSKASILQHATEYIKFLQQEVHALRANSMQVERPQFVFSGTCDSGSESPETVSPPTRVSPIRTTSTSIVHPRSTSPVMRTPTPPMVTATQQRLPSSPSPSPVDREVSMAFVQQQFQHQTLPQVHPVQLPLQTQPTQPALPTQQRSPQKRSRVVSPTTAAPKVRSTPLSKTRGIQKKTSPKSRRSPEPPQSRSLEVMLEAIASLENTTTTAATTTTTIKESTPEFQTIPTIDAFGSPVTPATEPRVLWPKGMAYAPVYTQSPKKLKLQQPHLHMSPMSSATVRRLQLAM
eukprot:m.229931 g.229931  ORF g.229931 m.229931 type:complete len:336 (-) comp33564_c22_seq1:182-1189(-)